MNIVWSLASSPGVLPLPFLSAHHSHLLCSGSQCTRMRSESRSLRPAKPPWLDPCTAGWTLLTPWFGSHSSSEAGQCVCLGRDLTCLSCQGCHTVDSGGCFPPLLPNSVWQTPFCLAMMKGVLCPTPEWPSGSLPAFFHLWAGRA